MEKPIRVLSIDTTALSKEDAAKGGEWADCLLLETRGADLVSEKIMNNTMV